MKSGRCLVLGVAVSLALMSPLAMSAEIAQDVLKSASALNPAQQKAVDAYVEEWASQLTKGDEDTVGDARLKLLEPLQRGGSATFNIAYSSSVSSALMIAMESERVQVKLNAMIIAAKLVDSSALKLVIKGLQDSSPACRIWGAKAAYEFAIGNRLTAANELELLKPLEGVLGRDSAPEVLEHVLRVMAEFKSDEAVKATLGALNQRLSLFAGDPKLGIRADLEGLRSVYQRMVQASAANQNVRADVTRLIGTVAFRHMTAAVRRADVNKGLRPDDKKMIELVDNVMPWVTKRLGNESATSPGPVGPLLWSGKYSEALLKVEDWKRFLTSPPLNYNAKDIEVSGLD